MPSELIKYLQKMGNIFKDDDEKHYHVRGFRGPIEMMTTNGCFMPEPVNGMDETGRDISLRDSKLFLSHNHFEKPASKTD